MNPGVLESFLNASNAEEIHTALTAPMEDKNS
jgi:hypothetical protein